MEYNEIENSTDEVLEINKKKKDFKIELTLFFILGFLVGITFKTEAFKRITIGFDDYKISGGKESYDISAIKKKLIEKSQNAEQSKQDSQLEEVQPGEFESGDGSGQ